MNVGAASNADPAVLPAAMPAYAQQARCRDMQKPASVSVPHMPESRLWFSDSEIAAHYPCTLPAYTTEDFRNELKRSERKAHGIVLLCVLALTALIIFAILFVMQSALLNF